MASSVKPAKRGSGKSGMGIRARVIIVLLGFVVVAIGVIARRSFGINVATELRTLEGQRDAIAASRIKVETDIRDASSRSKIVPIAEKRLHMYVPADSQVIILPRKPE
jgi:cell division protein FtsL